MDADENDAAEETQLFLAGYEAPPTATDEGGKEEEGKEPTEKVEMEEEEEEEEDRALLETQAYPGLPFWGSEEGGEQAEGGKKEEGGKNEEEDAFDEETQPARPFCGSDEEGKQEEGGKKEEGGKEEEEEEEEEEADSLGLCSQPPPFSGTRGHHALESQPVSLPLARRTFPRPLNLDASVADVKTLAAAAAGVSGGQQRQWMRKLSKGSGANRGPR